MTFARDLQHITVPFESNAGQYSLLSDRGNTVKLFMHLEKLYGALNPLQLTECVRTLVQEHALPTEVLHYTADLFTAYAVTALHGEGPDVAYYCFVHDFKECDAEQRKTINKILAKLLVDIDAAG